MAMRAIVIALSLLRHVRNCPSYYFYYHYY